MKKVFLSAVICSCAALSLNTQAGNGPPPPPQMFQSPEPYGYDDDEVYAGLTWVFGQGFIPQLELGYRNVDVDGDGDVTGYGISTSFIFNKGFDLIQVKGIRGNEDVQGQLGLGYSLLNRGFAGSLGAQGNHITGGVNYVGGQTPFQFFGGVNTVSDYSTRTRCPSGTIPMSGSGNSTCMPAFQPE